MPYSYGKENLGQDTRMVTQRRVAGAAALAPQRRGPGRPLAAPRRERGERREPGLAPVSRRVVGRQESQPGHIYVQMILGICLIVCSLAFIFARILLPNQFPVLQFSPSSQVEQTDQGPPIQLSFPVKKISQNVTAFSQADKTHYNNMDPEWSLWSNSACSGCAMAALLDAYGATTGGRPLNCGDVLEAEYRLSVYRPVNDWGLIKGEPGELAQTAAHFGFTGYSTQKLSLDDLITLANAGVPSIIRIPTHVMVLTGGDSQNVFLADSGGLHLSKVTRTQFLHGLPGSRLYAGQSWMVGWYIILTPDKKRA